MIDPGRDLPGHVVRGRRRELAESHPHIHPLDHDQIRLRLEVLMLNDIVINHQYASLVEVPRAEVFKTQKSENWTASDRRYVTVWSRLALI